tara:strand:- start:1372 stop:1617 length:246 start_codon:yes stop_codon:yes gene_type:complete
MALFWNRKVSGLKVYELAIGLSVWGVVLGMVFFLINNVFDLVGVRGATAEVVRQTANLLGSRSPGQFTQPIVQELQKGRLF